MEMDKGNLVVKGRARRSGIGAVWVQSRDRGDTVSVAKSTLGNQG